MQAEFSSSSANLTTEWAAAAAASGGGGSSSSYSVRVHGPPGWVFTPAAATISCDARGCNGGADVNFELSGVTLTGRIQPGPQASSCKAARSSQPSFAGEGRERVHQGHAPAWCSSRVRRCATKHAPHPPIRLPTHRCDRVGQEPGHARC
jgi:hypothetical protein